MPLSYTRCGGDEDFAAGIADLIAVPVDGGRALSFTGYTLAVGAMRANAAGELVLYGSGLSFLTSHVVQAKKIAADTPAHLIERLHVPFPSPEANLVIEPHALEWRLWKSACVIPTAAREIVCPDSRGLAEFVDGAMRKKERVRPALPVRAPALPNGRAA
mgnify:CR=1 FL=1